MANFKGKNLIILLLVIACGILGGGLVYFQFKVVKIPGEAPATLSAQEAAERGLGFINEKLLPQNVKASLVGVVPSEEEGLYKFKVKIGEKEFFSYISKDGKILFPEGINLEQAGKNAEKEEGTAKSCEDIPKKETPLLEAFVVSYCPYGTQMQRIFIEILKDIPSFFENMKIRYIGAIQDGKITSMHGEKEAQENLRQICLREEQKDKFINYLSCFLKEGKSKECLGEAGVDEERLSQCMQDSSRGLSYAREDFDLQDKHNITASPTLILNGKRVSEFDFGGRTAQAVKTLLCCGFIDQPESCKKDLSEKPPATGFSKTSGSGGSSGGACK